MITIYIALIQFNFIIFKYGYIKEWGTSSDPPITNPVFKCIYRFSANNPLGRKSRSGRKEKLEESDAPQSPGMGERWLLLDSMGLLLVLFLPFPSSWKNECWIVKNDASAPLPLILMLLLIPRPQYGGCGAHHPSSNQLPISNYPPPLAAGKGKEVFFNFAAHHHSPPGANLLKFHIRLPSHCHLQSSQNSIHQRQIPERWDVVPISSRSKMETIIIHRPKSQIGITITMRKSNNSRTIHQIT